VVGADEAGRCARQHAVQDEINEEETAVSMTATVQTHAPLGGAGSTARSPIARDRDLAAQAREREQLTDRLHSLRRVLPVLAQEMAAARRQAAHLRLDNRRLADQVRELRAELHARELRARR
jgi:hypothetical protein